jgi:type III secretion protein D
VSKRLRILTGHHAGASQDLIVGIHKVGSTDESDILISDWSGLGIEIEVDADTEAVCWRALQPQGTDVRLRRHALRDLVPARFGDVVLCAGPASAEWPADAVLLRQVFGPVSMIKRAASRHPVLVCAASAAVGVPLFLSSFFYAAPAESTPKMISPRERAEEIARHAAAMGNEGVTVSAEGSQIVVTGLLSDDSQVRKLRLALDHLADARNISHQYASATNVANMIQGAIGEAAVAVTHKGDGVFLVEGKVRSVETLQQRLAVLAEDMRANVRRVEVNVVELPAANGPRPSAMLSDDADSYVQTAEGIKHLGLLSAPSPTAAAGRTTKE